MIFILLFQPLVIVLVQTGIKHFGNKYDVCGLSSFLAYLITHPHDIIAKLFERNTFFIQYRLIDFNDAEGNFTLRVMRVGNADDRALGNRIIFIYNRFEIYGENLMPVEFDDDLLDPAADEHKAVFVHITDITGMNPFFTVFMNTDNIFGLFFIIVLTKHHITAGRAYLALLAE